MKKAHAKRKRELGNGKFEKILLTEEQKQWVRDHYNELLNDEMAEHLGVSRSFVIRYMRLNGLRRSKDSLFRIHQRFGRQNGLIYQQKSDEEKKAITCKKVERRHEIVESERLRIRWGLEQRTKMQLVRMSKAKVLMRLRLRRNGYVETGRNVFVVPLVRHLEQERRATEKYSITFIEQ